MDVVWAAVEPLLPAAVDMHPLGCHRPRVPDRLCFRGILIRPVTGASWVDVEAILDHRVSDTTLRARRDEWIDAGVFEALKAEALAAFDRIVGLDLDDVALDGSLHKAPYGGEGTGPNPTDRGKSGLKWSVASERHGVPIGSTIDGANRNDVRMLEPTLDAVARPRVALRHRHLAPRSQLRLRRGSHTFACRRDRSVRDPTARHQGPGVKKQPLRLGLRWVVEATNTWWSNYGQLRRKTDRKNCHRHAALCLAATILIVGKLITWRNRWSPT